MPGAIVPRDANSSFHAGFPGKPLQAYFNRAARALDPERSLWLIRTLASGLGQIHQQGLFHGDLRPENILVTKSVRLVMIDFNFSWPLGKGGNEVGRYSSPGGVWKCRVSCARGDK